MPQIDVNIEIEPGHRLQEMLLGEKIEFFVADVSQLTKDERLIEKKIGGMQVGYFVRRDHPLASRRNLAMPDIQKFPLITPSFRALAAPRQKQQVGWEKLAAKISRC